MGQPEGPRNGGHARVLIAGRDVPTIGAHDPPTARAAALRERGQSTPTMHELPPSEAGTFRDCISDLKEGNKFHASVHVYDEDEYRDMRLFVSDDGKAGFALHGDDIVSVYSRKDSVHPRAAAAVIATAVDQGGRRLDCFDTVLPSLYAESGFEPVSRVPWDDEYAPDGWDYSTYDRYNGGRPDVVLMAYNPEQIDSMYDPSQGRVCTDYDEAAALQHERVEQIAHGQP